VTLRETLQDKPAALHDSKTERTGFDNSLVRGPGSQKKERRRGGKKRQCAGEGIIEVGKPEIAWEPSCGKGEPKAKHCSQKWMETGKG